MFFNAPDHKRNGLSIQINGNFRDSKDSFYKIWNEVMVHITFIKRDDGVIFEEVRDLIILDDIEQFFPEELPNITYRSKFKSVRGYRNFLRDQPDFEEHKDILQKYVHHMYGSPKFDPWSDTPF